MGSAICLLHLQLGFILLSIGQVNAAHKKVLLADVETLTLRNGEYTTGRRGSPVPQLRCVGGAARGHYTPRVVQCVKTGHDGVDYQWRCSADMPDTYEFGKITVTCEGFDYPNDPYILHGSCGLEFDLEYASDAKRGSSVKRSQSSSWAETIVPIIVIIFIAYVVYLTCSGATGDRDPNVRRGFGFPGSGPGGGGPGYPPGPPPPYDDSFSQKPSSSQQGSGPGFWTGAGLGALGGYFLGRNNNPGPSTSTSRRYHSEQWARDTGFHDDTAPSTHSSTMTTSTGYGGTRRR